jgi:hypothetical protein
MDSLIVAVFTFGFSIFYALSCIEIRTWPLMRRVDHPKVADADTRFVHAALKRLTPLLPPSNGLVIIAGTTLLVMQAIGDQWSLVTTVPLVGYWVSMLSIIIIGRNPAVVRDIRAHDSQGDITLVRLDVRRVSIQHHAALFTNLAVVIYQFVFFVFA